MKLYECPRCGWESLEKLVTYAHCINCNYNTVEDGPLKSYGKDGVSKKIEGDQSESKRIDVDHIKEIQDKLLTQKSKR